MRKPALELQDITFQYSQLPGGAQAGELMEPLVEGLNLSVREGEFVSIVGPSGSGKSTLFRLITGLEQPESAGVIRLNGEVVRERLGKVGYMPQQDLLLPWRTVLDNAVLPLELKGAPKAAAREQASRLLAEFGLAGSEARYPDELSGGMRQRVSFLRSILSGSNVLLLDEPFSALDAITRLSMQEWLLEQWQRLNLTILFITHDVDEALFLSDRIVVCAERPIRRLEEVEVPLARPRTVRELARAAELKEALLARLRVSVV